jgi:hypothetical protein
MHWIKTITTIIEHTHTYITVIRYTINQDPRLICLVLYLKNSTIFVSPFFWNILLLTLGSINGQQPIVSIKVCLDLKLARLIVSLNWSFCLY